MDPTMIAAGIGGVLGLGNALIGERSQAAANVANRDLSQEMAQFNAAQAGIDRSWQERQAQTQMAFQERMANTAHQREIADLKKAGLNPLLSAGGSGAPSPQGAAGSGSTASGTAATMKSTFVPLDALGMLKYVAESDLLTAQADNLRAGAENYKSSTSYTNAKGPREERLATQEIARSKDEMLRNKIDKLKGKAIDAVIDNAGKVLDFNNYSKKPSKPGVRRLGLD